MVARCCDGLFDRTENESAAGIKRALLDSENTVGVWRVKGATGKFGGSEKGLAFAAEERASGRGSGHRKTRGLRGARARALKRAMNLSRLRGVENDV